MADRYILKGMLGTESLPGIPFPSERLALQRAGELFDEHGPSLELEIFLNDIPPALLNSRWMSRWNAQRLQTLKSSN
jgi:hypothetical protein